MKILKLSPEKEDLLHEIIARAIQRAMDNGTYVHIPLHEDTEEEKGEVLSIAQ
ncbi:hypothetical protein [Paenibacillus xanthanilyticus]|uniref:4-oxalocrotonate tautomerase n=1 Tax=Paenibacillus xanthanilyticus TaxID=1783531 RepID=A0ABV8KA13_9BACL